MARLEPALKKVIRWEGGYQRHENDPGNYNSDGDLVGTNHGISAPVAENFLGFPPNRKMMYNMKFSLAMCIYRDRFWNRIKGHEIASQQLANILFDGHVNHGTWGIRIMQDVVGVKRDGIVGPITLGAINRADPKDTFNNYKQKRIDFYHAIVRRSPHMRVFLRGWLNRINSFQYQTS